MKKLGMCISRRYIIITLTVVQIAISLSSKCYSQNTTIINLDKISSTLDSIAKKYKVPGLSISVVSKDTVISVYNYGYSKLEKKIKVSSNTKFGVGSITKSFLALGFLKLLEEGKVDLSTPVRELIPEISIENDWEKTNPVRIVHLLEHTAGLEDIHSNDASVYNNSQTPLINAIKKQKNSLKVRWKPGSRYSYSSVGYTIAGYILEKISGQKYEDYLEKYILTPLDMCNSSFYFPNENDIMLATGYEGLYKLPRVYMNSRPAGSMFSTASDFSYYLRFMLNYGSINNKMIYKKVSIKRMETPTSSVVAKEGLKIGYGLGLSSSYKNGFLWYGHTGGGPGCLAKYAYCRELDIAYVFMMNSFNIEAEKVIKEAIVNLITTPKKPTAKSVLKSDKNLYQQYEGYYELSNHRLDLFAWMSIIFDGINIEIENDTLISKSFLGHKTQLLPITDKLYRESNEPGPSAIFMKTENDNLIFQKGSNYYIKTPGWKPWFYRILFVVSILLMISIIFVTLIWGPIYLARKLIFKKTVSKNIKLILFPFLAIFVLLVGISAVSNQNSVQLTQKTNANIMFCLSTYLFALFSLVGVYMVIVEAKGLFKSSQKIYTALVSLAFLGFTVFLNYWGIIGLRLWAF